MQDHHHTTLHRERPWRTSFWLILLSAFLVFGFGYYAGARQASLFAEGGKTEIKTLAEVKGLLDEGFISWKSTTTIPTDKELEYGMISGYVDAYKDPYTTFLPPREAKSFGEEVQGSFGGVGMQVGKKEGNIVVIAPLKDSPAMKAGIKAGDVVLEINGTSTQGMSADEAVSHIRGEIGTKVTLKLFGKESQTSTTTTIVREAIKIPTIETEKKRGAYIIRLFNFSAESPDLFKKAAQEFIQNGGTRYLILDLRGNPGGYLEAAVDMTSLFLPEGAVIVGEKNDKGINEKFRSVGYDIFNKNLRMVVLVDEGTASASEIMAGALRDHGIATIVGTKTFGKGSVQQLFPLTDGSALKMTIATWLTPKGVNISETGIVPDVEIALDVKKFSEQKIDTQLEKAIDIVTSLK